MAEKIFVQPAESATRFEAKRQGYTITFVNSPDFLECRCMYEPSNIGGNPLAALELQEHLAHFKIREGIIEESVVSLLLSAASGKSVSGLLLAKGMPMVPGEDGQISIAVVDDLAEEKSEKEETFEAVDFRHVQSFLNVEAGDLIATIKPPGSGKPGRSVTGNIIQPQSGAPVKLCIGENIRIGEDGNTLFAASAGRVIYKDGEISVSDIYEVEGDVDFKVGNISFKGYVEVKGDILDDFFVKATKGIKIHGNIGVCTVESDGDISFCGMNGQGAGIIKCGGNIAANFIYDTNIECAGNLLAETEIRNSHIKCLGSISINKGGLTGGEYFALAGIECGNLGSVTSLHTRVVAGVHYGDLTELNGLFNELKVLVAEFSAAPKGTLDMKAFAAKRAEITERTQAVRSRTYEQCNPKINVKKMLYEGVSITLGIITETINVERKGPVSIIENSIEGGLRFLGMTALSFNSQAIEETFVKQYQLDQQKKPIESTGGAIDENADS
ncbi:MAG: FapA family protein [Desulfuromonadaceae bacterium]|nr:FapA family protein [Desulfuromonadaceae bacterium]MDD2856239.1 FapA family protein [Desulfuromonadaceae bacterium]